MSTARRQNSKLLFQYPLHIHFLYWIGIVILWLVFALLIGIDFEEALYNKLGYLPAQLVVTYAFLYYLLPQLLKRSYMVFLAGMIILTYASTVLARFMKIYFYETLINFESEKDSIFEILTQIEALLAQYLIWVFLTPALTIIVVFVINHFKERERLAHFKNKRNLTELKFLKAQLHPHFLFNTLNNLYTLAIQKSPKTPIVTQRLYEIFEYIFNRSNERVVQINQEIKLIKNYVELEKLRYDERLNVTLEENISDSSQPIVPLLLLSVVENAFKHGVSGDLNNPTIDIQIEEDDGRLNFIIENTKPTVLSADIQGYRKGIGVNNITRQLEILYPERHSYEVIETSDKYKVDIVIHLDSLIYSTDWESSKFNSITL